jgi:hypothetical protein
MPPEAEKRMSELQELSPGPPSFIDLTDPWMDAPA